MPRVPRVHNTWVASLSWQPCVIITPPFPPFLPPVVLLDQILICHQQASGEQSPCHSTNKNNITAAVPSYAATLPALIEAMEKGVRLTLLQAEVVVVGVMLWLCCVLIFV